MEFLSILRSSLQSSLHPIVFVLTTEHEATDAEFFIEKSFGAALLTHPKVKLIKGNAVNSTEIVKAIKRVAESVKQRRKRRGKASGLAWGEYGSEGAWGGGGGYLNLTAACVVSLHVY